ncbi:unnamed protein product [Candida verbasci]|uniref:Uncharacterized protein n=1 Tax=Candida verbasci TaxID=1227364 RepID=A0A9W4XNC1_9ASCO|nr:unnamed protein product [Candida verbasci]
MYGRARIRSTAILLTRLYSLNNILNDTRITIPLIKQLLPAYKSLSTKEKRQLIEKNENFLNLKFKMMINDSSPEIFKFIVDNYKILNNELVELYIFNLIYQFDLKPVNLLLHKLLSCDFKISNEIWCYYLNQVLLHNDHLGAMLIYHEIIDNWKFYTQDITNYLPMNDQISFLITPSNLEQFGVIFKNNNDIARIKGLLSYFKRFYSFHKLNQSYKNLLILLIETHSRLDNYEEAILSLNKLCYLISDKTPNKNYHSRNNINWRVLNIKTNQFKLDDFEEFNLDIHQNLICNILKLDKYNPIIQRNVYKSPNKSPIPFIASTISISDLPEFEFLLSKKIQDISNKEDLLNKLIDISQSSHYSINLFIISSLCKLKKFDIILQFIKHISIRNGIDHSKLVKHQSFINIFQCMANSLQDNIDPDIITLSTEIFNQHKILNSGSINLKVLKSYIKVLLYSNNQEEIIKSLQSLTTYKSKQSKLLILNDKLYDNYKNLKLNNTYDSLVTCI